MIEFPQNSRNGYVGLAMKSILGTTDSFCLRNQGATSVEYAVALALIIALCLPAISSLGGALTRTFQNAGGAFRNRDSPFRNWLIDSVVQAGQWKPVPAPAASERWGGSCTATPGRQYNCRPISLQELLG